MAKEEKNTGTGDIGVKPGEVGNEGQVKAVLSPTKILTGEDAKVLAAQFKRDGDKVTWVTEDCNVFYPENEHNARNHASKQRQKLFEVIWD